MEIFFHQSEEPILDNIPKNDEKKNLVHKGLIYKMSSFLSPLLIIYQQLLLVQ